MEIITRGLGAGSYPEPPFVAETPYPMCMLCGIETEQQYEWNGIRICEDCVVGLVLEKFPESAPEYICKDSFAGQDFYLSYLFGSLSREERICVIKDWWTEDADWFFAYVRENKREFLQFLAEKE